MRHELMKVVPAHSVESIDVDRPSGCIISAVNLSSVFSPSAHVAIENKTTGDILWVSHGEGAYQVAKEIEGACVITLKLVNNTEEAQTMGAACDIDDR